MVYIYLHRTNNVDFKHENAYPGDTRLYWIEMESDYKRRHFHRVLYHEGGCGAASNFEGVKSGTERWLVKLPQNEWAERRESISKRSSQTSTSRTVQLHQRLVTYSQMK